MHCHGWESNPGFLENQASQDGLHNHPLRILHHQPAHTHSIVVAFNLSQFTAAIDEINHVITHGNKCK